MYVCAEHRELVQKVAKGRSWMGSREWVGVQKSWHLYVANPCCNGVLCLLVDWCSAKCHVVVLDRYLLVVRCQGYANDVCLWQDARLCLGGYWIYAFWLRLLAWMSIGMDFHGCVAWCKMWCHTWACGSMVHYDALQITTSFPYFSWFMSWKPFRLMWRAFNICIWELECSYLPSLFCGYCLFTWIMVGKDNLFGFFGAKISWTRLTTNTIAY